MFPLFPALLVLALFMTKLFLIAIYKKNNGVADIGYGIAFIVLIGATLFQTYPAPWYTNVLIFLVCVWGLRLAIRIHLKNLGKPEDFRYRAWREAWGNAFLRRSFLQIYMLQGAVIFTVALPVTLSLVFPLVSPLSPLIYAGIMLWVIGFIFESVGDYQLDAFIRNKTNQGKIMMSGLWKYSRHPNYFGEMLMWWSLAIAGFGITLSPAVFLSPVLISFLLLKVSGVPMLEQRWEGNKEWNAYKERTSVLLPLPPRKDIA